MDPQNALLFRELYTDELYYHQAGSTQEANQVVELREKLITNMVNDKVAPIESLRQFKDHPWVRRRSTRQFAPRRDGASTGPGQLIPFSQKSDGRQLVTLRQQPDALTEKNWNQGVNEAQRAQFMFTALAFSFMLMAFIVSFFPLLLGTAFFGIGILCARHDIRGYHRRLEGSTVKTLAPLESVRRASPHRAEMGPASQQSIGHIQYAVMADYEGGEDVRVALLRYHPESFAIENPEASASAYRAEVVEEQHFTGDELVAAASYRAELEHQARKQEEAELAWQQQLAGDIEVVEGEIQGEVSRQQERQEAARQLARALDASERRLIK